MPTITIEAEPESIAALVASLPPDDRARFDAALRNFSTAPNIPDETIEESDYDRETNEADLEAIGRGLKAVAEGRTIPADVAFAQLRERLKKSGSHQ